MLFSLVYVIVIVIGRVVANSLFLEELEDAVRKVWSGLVVANEDRSPFLLHRPYSETPGDAVSEGVGYGLLTAWALNDTYVFHRLYQGADSTMWNGRFYDWRVDASNQKVAFGAATDAEQDIAASLILVLYQMDTERWPVEFRGIYRERAQTLLNHLWEEGVTPQGILRPGYGWGGEGFVNVGYFAPAWYRLFHEFDAEARDWITVVDRSYNVLRHSPGYDRGLVPDWMTPEGQFVDDTGYNAYGKGRYMYKDAIRTLWRIGTDALWFGDERASEYLSNARFFLEHIYGGIQSANFFQMDGTLVPVDDVWIFDGGARQRSRREHSPLTVGMWSIPIFVEGSDSEKRNVVRALLSFYTPNASYWGLMQNPSDPLETVDHNEMYFEQFLASFGAMILSGQWIDAWRSSKGHTEHQEAGDRLRIP